MKPSIVDSLEKLSQEDRDENNYVLVTDKNSPNNGKYVLLLDGAHPVQVKNTELLAKEANREIEKQTAVAAAVQPKETEIANLRSQLTAAQANTGIPAGQVAVSTEKIQLLSQYETLGKFDDVKTKVEEHGTLKEQTAAADRKTLFSNIAKAHGLDEEAFAKIAEQTRLDEKIEAREEVPDPKKPEEKVNRYYVKGKNPATGAETTTIVSEFVKQNDDFKPFISSLISVTVNNKRKLPETGVGDTVEDTSAASAYIGRNYKRPDKQEKT